MRVMTAACVAVLLASALRADGVEKVLVGPLLEKPDDWFASAEGKRIVDNIITWQNANGGWWKAYDPSAPRDAASKPEGDDATGWHRTSTIDNKATYTEIRVLARAFRVKQDERYRVSMDKGLKFLLDAQYPNGGWPQRYPIEQTNYGRHITYNDDAMVGVMNLLRDMAAGGGDFAFLSAEQRAACRAAFDRGINCFVATQIRGKDGRLTAWCQQHDAESLAPAGARSYELPSICTTESWGILRVLMSLPEPDDRVRAAIHAAAAWFDAVKITGKRVDTLTGEQVEGGRDKVLVNDPAAPPIWARFYDIETNEPFFVGRDGQKRSSFGDVPRERRVGYAWFTNSGAKVADAYQKWSAEHGKAGDTPVTKPR